MKNNNQDNDELQITLEGFAQILQEIKEAVMNNPHSALTADLLIKIQQTIDQSKKGITAEELETFKSDLIASIKKMQEEANESFIGFLNEKVEEMSQLSKRPTMVENRYSIDFKSSKMWIAMIIAVFFWLFPASEIISNIMTICNIRIMTSNTDTSRWSKV